MQILVSGSYGYIGSQVLSSLAEHPELRNAEIAAVDNWSYGRGAAPLAAFFQEKLPRFRSYCLDISDGESPVLRKLIAKSRHIINCASLTQIPNSDLHTRYIRDGARTLSDMILATGPNLGKVIDISSTSIYGPVRSFSPPVSEPYNEKIYPDPAKALHNYAANKLAMESIWLAERCRGIPVTVLRLSTVFGYALGMRYNQFINQFLVDAVCGRSTTLPGAPNNWRPYIHVKDAVGVMIHLLDHDSHTHHEVINTGASELNPQAGDLFVRLATLLRERYGILASYRFAIESDPSALQESYRVDFSKLSQMVGYRLRHNFETGAADLVTRMLSAQETKALS